MSETLCRCGAMRMLDPDVSCERGNWIHTVGKCEPTCDECRALRAQLADREREVATRREQVDSLATANEAANRRAEAAERERDEARAVLREVEWEGMHLGRGCCPSCGGLPPLPPGCAREFTLKDDVVGHYPDCRLAAAQAGEG